MSTTPDNWPGIPKNGNGEAVSVVAVRALTEGVLHIRWDDGVERDVDVAAMLSGHPLLEALRDNVQFADVKVGEFGGVEWGNGIDMCPHALRIKADEQYAARLSAAE